MNIALPKMYKWQQDVFLGLKNNWKDSIHVIKSRRQCGKSILAEFIMLYTSLSNNNYRCYIIEPTFAQADKVMNDLKKMILGKPFLKKVNDLRRQVFFKNGSEIRMFSAEQGVDALQGYTCELLIIDEAAYTDEDIIDTVFPYVNTTKGPILMFSTPKTKSGTFYNYYSMGFSAEDNRIYSYDWAKEDISELLSPIRFEQLRKTMDPLKFRTYYLGEFLDGQSKFFSDFTKCLLVEIPVFYPNQEDIVFGIDWAGSTGGDFTAISIIGKRTKKVYDIVYFNDKDPKATLEEIKKLALKYHPKKITVELNSIGNVYYNLLKDKMKLLKIPVIGFTTTNETKDKIISKLQTAFQNEQIYFFRIPELMDELQEYTLEFSKTGKRVFNASKGHHDDLVMALAIGYNSLNSGEYHIGFA